MKNLFEQIGYSESPLADKMRPRNFDEFCGQDFLIGKEKPLRKIIDTDKLTSIILWGPPGTGKTTIGRIIASKTNSYFEEFSAVTSGISDLRKVVISAKERKGFYNLKTVLFVDEIHRFNKSQQDGFLPHIENGTLILVGATTENPGFEINSALLSRSLLFELKKLEDDDIKKIVLNTLDDKERGLGKQKIKLSNEALQYLVKTANGDARNAINALEIASATCKKNGTINKGLISDSLNKKIITSYKNGDSHYDLISAFIKSMRGSDPNASVYWLARMIESGEDPKFIARRMIVFASEDIGNAAPMALLLAVACFDAVNYIGLPEAKINLAQCAIYLASAPKSNSSYLAIIEALTDVRNSDEFDIPKHLKNAPTKFAKDLGYGKEYLYPHDYLDARVMQEYLPKKIINKVYYQPTDRGAEAEIKIRLAKKKANK